MQIASSKDLRMSYLCALLLEEATDPQSCWTNTGATADFAATVGDLAAHLDFNAVGLVELLHDDFHMLFRKLAENELIEAEQGTIDKICPSPEPLF